MVEYLTVKNLTFFLGISMLLNLFLFFSWYFIKSNFSRYRFILKQEVKDLLDHEAKEILLNLYEIMDQIVGNFDNDSKLKIKVRNRNISFMSKINNFHGLALDAPNMVRDILDCIPSEIMNTDITTVFDRCLSFLNWNRNLFTNLEGKRIGEIEFLFSKVYFEKSRIAKKEILSFLNELSKK